MASSVGIFLRSLTIAGAVAAGAYFAAGLGASDNRLFAHEAKASEAEHPAVVYRQSLMQTMKWHIGHLGGMAKGEMEFNAEAANRHATVISALATAIPEGFPEGSGTENSKALPDIWEDFAGFEENANDLHVAASELASAEDVSADNLGGYVQKIGGACGACHDDFRAD